MSMVLIGKVPLQGVINILEAILEAGLGGSVRFFEASSCEIFGKSRGFSCDEESAMHPQTPYGIAKLLAHLAVRHYRCYHGSAAISSQAVWCEKALYIWMVPC